MFLTYKYVFLFCCGTEKHGKEKKRKNKFSFSTPLRVFFSESKEEEQENINALFGQETLTFHITPYQQFAAFTALRFKVNINQLEW